MYLTYLAEVIEFECASKKLSLTGLVKFGNVRYILVKEVARVYFYVCFVCTSGRKVRTFKVL